MVGYGLTSYLLGLAYAIWSGLGTAGAVLAGVLVLNVSPGASAH